MKLVTLILSPFFATYNALTESHWGSAIFAGGLGLFMVATLSPLTTHIEDHQTDIFYLFFVGIGMMIIGARDKK